MDYTRYAAILLCVGTGKSFVVRWAAINHEGIRREFDSLAEAKAFLAA